MSELTLAELLSFDPTSLVAASLAWLAVAEDFDNTCEIFIRATRDLSDAWPEGEASEAAQRRATTLRAEVSNAYPPARQIGQALQRLADGMAQLKGYAQEIVAEARARGLQVDVAAGTVTAPVDMYRSGAPDHTARLVNGYITDLNTVLERARGLDDATVRLINENLPDPVLGFGTAVPPAVSRQDVLSQQQRDPRAVRFWWENLTPVQQEQVIAEFPELIGWLDGVPATDRDAANRLRLSGDVEDLRQRADDLRQQIAAVEADPADTAEGRRTQNHEIEMLRRELGPIEAELARLGKVEVALAGLGEQGLLVGYDPAGDGKAIVAVGNPDTARHTAVWVPGVDSTLDGIKGDVDRVQNLRSEADQLTAGSAGDVSAIMWLGYDAPEKDLSMVLHERSEQGGEALDRFVIGLHATHDGGENHLTAVGHSYGSTVVAEAAQSRGGLVVNDIVVAGSPGMHAENAADLNIDPQHVWAGSAPGDFVSDASNHPAVVGAQAPAGLGGVVAGAISEYEQFHGDSPHRPEFGANRFHVDTTGHSAYWDKDTESLRNQAYIVVGDYDGVTLDHGSRPS